MLYRKNMDKSLSDELFLNPDAEYRGTPFWSWNCRVTKELIDSQLEVFEKMGFGGLHLHPRTGLETPYLGDEFLDLVQYADERLKEKNMLCWLYDEDRYPSGAAGGIVTENPMFRARHLLLTREMKAGMCDSYEDFCRRVEAGEKPAGYYVTAYRILTKDGFLVSYERIDGPAPETDSISETMKKGRLWFAYVELMRESPWYNNQTYVDVMNKKAIERFVEVTHERYAQALSQEFGKSIPAIFTDEPQLKGSMALSDGESEADVTLSWTDDFSETYRQTYGTALLDVLPELLWDFGGGRYSVHRYQYHNHLSERFVSAYSDTLAAWCGAHNLALTGHYMSEPTLYSQTLRLGEAMRCYRNQQLPGIDILCGDPEYSTVKQAVSVARQNGREGVLSELYGVTHWDFDFKGHKLQGDWMAALGITIRCHHLAFMSMEGEAKRDWPASISYQSPWWEKYSYIENYFARVNTALTRGQALVDVAVVHPIESYWICYGPAAQSGEKRAALDENFSQLINWLLFGTIDFDFISESLLPGQRKAEENGYSADGTVKDGAASAGSVPDDVSSAETGRLRVGEMSYHTVLVPGLVTIRSSTLDALEELLDQGGRVLFLGNIPALVDGKASDRAFKLAERAKKVAFESYEVLCALNEDREVEVRRTDGARANNLFHQIRADGSDRWLFLCHVNRKKTRVDQAENLIVTVKGCYRVQRYDALTGEIHEEAAECENGCTRIRLRMYAEDSALWRLGPVISQGNKNVPGTEGTVMECEAATAITEAAVTGGTVPASESEKASTDSAEPAEDTFPVPTGTTRPAYGLVAGPAGVRSKPAKVLVTLDHPDDFRTLEPNVLLLDQAQWKLDEGGLMPRQEILRLDNEIRTILGFPHRQDAYIQPWRVGQVPEDHLVTLRYEFDSEVETESAVLAMERPEKAKITLNGTLCPYCPVTYGENQEYYVDSFIRMTKLCGLRRGSNELILQIPYGQKTNLENLYLLGDFGVDVMGTRAYVTAPAAKVFFGDITRQRLPFYGGSVEYKMAFSLDQDAVIGVRVPHFTGPVMEVFVDGESKGLIAFAPHVLGKIACGAGSHRLTIRLYGNRFNTFGTLHNGNEEFKWYGPDSYRTKGYDWTEGYALRPFGILSRVEIIQEAE